MGSTSAQRIRVGVECADALIARGIVAVLRQEPDLEVAVADAPRHPGVQVCVTDFDRAMAQVAVPRPQPSLPGPPALLVYSPARRERDIREALAHGIPGFLGQGFDLVELPQAVRTLARGGRYYDAATTQRAAASLASESLTGRELEVLALIVRGECNKTIAARLAVTVGTVKAHVGAVLSKLQVVSRTQAVRVAVSRGLVDAPWEPLAPAAPRPQRPHIPHIPRTPHLPHTPTSAQARCAAF